MPRRLWVRLGVQTFEMLEYILKNLITDFKLQNYFLRYQPTSKLLIIFLLILPFVELGAYPMDSPALQTGFLTAFYRNQCKFGVVENAILDKSKWASRT